MNSNSRFQTSDPNRRQFLHRCAGCALAGGCASSLVGLTAGPVRAAARAADKPRIRLVFSHIPPGQPTWPHLAYDYEARKQLLTAKLVDSCPEIELLPVTVHNADETKTLLAEDKNVDGYIVYMLGLWTGAGATVAASGKPTLFVDDLYGGSGEFLIQYSAARRAGRTNVAAVSSSRLEDVACAARTFATIKQPGAAEAFAATCMAAERKTYAPVGDMTLAPGDSPPRVDVAEATKRLRESTILVIGSPMQGLAEAISNGLGTKVVPLDYVPLDAAYKKADQDQAKAIADGWIKGAAQLVEPSVEDVQKSAAMYLAMKAVMKEHDARAITINCLGGFYGGHMAAYPCLGFCQFNNDGLVGACEADMKSTITMLSMSLLVGRPGYISDPVIDTSTNQIIYAHCVAPYKVFGPDGPTNPYQIRSHSEDRKGASMRSLMPLGRMTTTIEIDPSLKRILFHQGKTVANVDEDKACRSKLAADVKGDITKLMSFWDQWGWHRVTFFGDLKDPVFTLAEKLGYQVIEEA